MAVDMSNIQATRKAANVIEQSTSKKGQQGTASESEKKERANALKTQGRKGCKATRINMAFTPDNMEFVKVMARVNGQNMTEFTNFVIEAYRNEHPDIYEKAKAVIELTQQTRKAD